MKKLGFLTSGAAIHDWGRPVPEGLDGEVRRTVPGARVHVDHRHATAEFDLVVRGIGSYVLNDDIYELKPGMLVWLLPERRHRLVRSPNLEMWVVTVQTHLLQAEWLSDIAKQPSHVLPGEELLDLDRLLSQVAQDSDDPPAYNAGIRYVVARAWRAGNVSPVSDVKPMHPAVLRALMLLREESAAQSLSDLAEEAGVAAPYLSRLLVEHTGHSFVEWRSRVRLERFIAAYRPGDNLLKASLDAGFGSYSRFHSTFMEMMGCSPSEWAKQTEGGLIRNTFDRSPLADTNAAPHSITSSIRQRWVSLVPAVSPAAATAFGRDFLDRLLSARSDARPAGEMELDNSLAEADRRRFIASMERENPVFAQAYDEMIGAHDVAGTYAGLLREFDLSPHSLGTAAAAMVAGLWTTIHDAGDPDIRSVQSLARQCASALDASAPARDAAQAAHTALMCHFVVLYHALQAVRARGDDRVMTRLAGNARISASRILGHDLTGLKLDSHGLKEGRP